MEQKNVNCEVLEDIYKNAHIALISISDVAPENEDEAMKEELSRQYEGYEKLIGEISAKMKECGVEGKEPGGFKKAMLWSSIKLNTIADNSPSHIADMMLQGTVMGITELRQIINEKKNILEEDTLCLANKLLELEEGYETRLKDML